MSLIQVKLKHGRTFDDAKAHLARAVADVQARFGVMVQKAEWSAARDAVTLAGPGVRLDLRVDAEEVHVEGDIPLLGGLLGGSSGVKKMVEAAFHKQLN